MEKRVWPSDEVEWMYAATHSAEDLLDGGIISSSVKDLAEKVYRGDYIELTEPDNRWHMVPFLSYADEHNPNPLRDRTKEILFISDDLYSKISGDYLQGSDFKDRITEIAESEWILVLTDRSEHHIRPISKCSFLEYEGHDVAAIEVDYENIAILSESTLI